MNAVAAATLLFFGASAGEATALSSFHYASNAEVILRYCRSKAEDAAYRQSLQHWRRVTEELERKIGEEILAWEGGVKGRSEDQPVDCSSEYSLGQTLADFRAMIANVEYYAKQ